jgi:hypothetical protein
VNLGQVLEIQVELGPDAEDDPDVVDASKAQDGLQLGQGDVKEHAALGSMRQCCVNVAIFKIFFFDKKWE